MQNFFQLTGRSVTVIVFAQVEEQTLAILVIDAVYRPVDVFPPLLLIVGILVIIYAVAMLAITSTVVTSLEETDEETAEPSESVIAVDT